jgi:hypothetical protein
LHFLLLHIVSTYRNGPKGPIINTLGKIVYIFPEFLATEETEIREVLQILSLISVSSVAKYCLKHSKYCFRIVITLSRDAYSSEKYVSIGRVRR